MECKKVNVVHSYKSRPSIHVNALNGVNRIHTQYIRFTSFSKKHCSTVNLIDHHRRWVFNQINGLAPQNLCSTFSTEHLMAASPASLQSPLFVLLPPPLPPPPHPIQKLTFPPFPRRPHLRLVIAGGGGGAARGRQEGFGWDEASIGGNRG